MAGVTEPEYLVPGPCGLCGLSLIPVFTFCRIGTSSAVQEADGRFFRNVKYYQVLCLVESIRYLATVGNNGR